jgi:hypothetical protein
MSSTTHQEITMKSNEIVSKSFFVKLVGVALLAALSGCAVTGPSSEELTADMSFNDIHHGP